jgi:hypothetical protein
MTRAASFRRTLFLTRVPKGTGRFLMRRLASLIYIFVYLKKKSKSIMGIKAAFHGKTTSID